MCSDTGSDPSILAPRSAVHAVVLWPSRDGRGVSSRCLLAPGGLPPLAQRVLAHRAPILFEACLQLEVAVSLCMSTEGDGETFAMVISRIRLNYGLIMRQP